MGERQSSVVLAVMRAAAGAWLAGMLTACAATETAGSRGPLRGTAPATTTATDFAARDVDGRTFRLSDHLGKEVVLLDFWATWCEPCLAEMPHLEALYEAHKAEGFRVVAIAMDGPETVADVPSFAKRHAMSFPVVLDEDSHAVSIYNPKHAAPLSVLINRKGAVVRVRESYNPGDEDLVAKDVAQALAGAL